jgi:hypothetical protein
LILLLSLGDRKDYTLIDLPSDCVNCIVCTDRDLFSRVAAKSELLHLWFDRGAGNDVVSLDVEEDLTLALSVALRFVASFYSTRCCDGTACYSCACRGLMDVWWYFEEGRFPRLIKRSVSRVKQRLSCVFVDERVLKRGRIGNREALCWLCAVLQ